MTDILLFPDDKADAYAIQALFLGTASEAQQQRAMKWIVYELCGTYAQTFDPDSQRKTDFSEGRRSVGRALVGIANFKLGMLDEQAPKPTKVERKRR